MAVRVLLALSGVQVQPELRGDPGDGGRCVGRGPERGRAGGALLPRGRDLGGGRQGHRTSHDICGAGEETFGSETYSKILCVYHNEHIFKLS